MKKFLLLITVIMTVSLTGCEVEARQQTADEKMANQTRQSMAQANAQIGMPAIVNFQERKLAKMIFELRDQEKLVTYAYIVNKMTGKLSFIGKCIGYGLPYSVQYTNPQKVVNGRGGPVSYLSETNKVLPQADPNGLFMPQGLSATWLMMIDPATNNPRPVYFEPEIVVSPFPLHSE